MPNLSLDSFIFIDDNPVCAELQANYPKENLATQGVKVHNVPGNHLSLNRMAKPDLQVLAAKFKLCLEKVPEKSQAIAL